MDFIPSSRLGGTYYPCDRGQGGPGVSMHEFVNSAGVILCRYCGKRAPAEPIKVTFSATTGGE